MAVSDARWRPTSKAVRPPAVQPVGSHPPRSIWRAKRGRRSGHRRPTASAPSRPPGPRTFASLGEAFDRLGREYPSTRDGLSLTERRILAAVADGAADAGSAFVRSSARETRPYLGDTWCFAAVERMARAPVPLLDLDPREDPGPVDRTTRLQLTDAGARVLAGEADHVQLNGIDRWIGGVHLHGRQVPWRWDDGTETLTAVQEASGVT